MRRPVHVFFFRGLNTYGDDNAKWSIFNFGPVYRHLARELEKQGVAFHPVIGMGAGSISAMAKRARAFLESHPVWRDPNVPVHFLGHSAGGLVSRHLVGALEAERGQELRQKLLSHLTVATPHRGATLARVALEMPERYKGSTLLLRTFGYDVRARRALFTELTRENIERELGFDTHSTIPIASIVCAAPRGQWCVPLRLFYMVKAFNDFRLPSDGVVDRDSQTFGEVVAEVPLDHFRQVGLFGEQERFREMCATMAGFFARRQDLAANCHPV